MLDLETFVERLDEFGFSQALLDFLTDEERVRLERIVIRFDRHVSNPTQDIEAIGAIIWAAQRRAAMRHPGFE
jgi:hypothetical protein